MIKDYNIDDFIKFLGLRSTMLIAEGSSNPTMSFIFKNGKSVIKNGEDHINNYLYDLNQLSDKYKHRKDKLERILKK